MDEILGMWPNKNKQEVMGNLNHSVMNNEIEGGKNSKILPTNESPIQMYSLLYFTRF